MVLANPTHTTSPTIHIIRNGHKRECTFPAYLHPHPWYTTLNTHTHTHTDALTHTLTHICVHTHTLTNKQTRIHTDADNVTYNLLVIYL